MPTLGGPELAVILVLFVLLFGARKLPELGRAVGETIAGLRQGFDDEDDGG